MAKVYGSLTPNKDKVGKQPDFRGRAKLGGGERDEEHAAFLRNLSLEFKEKGETWISIAGWKRVNDAGEHFVSLALEDNSYQTARRQSQAPVKKHTEKEFDEEF